MEMHSQALDRDTFREQQTEHIDGLIGSCNPDSITEREFLNAHLKQRLSDSENMMGIDVSFVGTSKDSRDIATHRDTFLARQVYYRTEICQALSDSRIDIMAREAFASGSKDGDRAHTSRESTFHALEIRHQDRILCSGQSLQTCHHSAGIAKLRNSARADK